MGNCKECGRALKDPKAEYGWRCAQKLGILRSLDDIEKQKQEDAFWAELNRLLSKGKVFDADQVIALRDQLLDDHVESIYKPTKKSYNKYQAEYDYADQETNEQDGAKSLLDRLLGMLADSAYAEDAEYLFVFDTPKESEFEFREIGPEMDMATITIENVLNGNQSDVDATWQYLQDHYDELILGDQWSVDKANEKMSQLPSGASEGERLAIKLELCADIAGHKIIEPNKSILDHPPIAEAGECPPLDKLSGLIYAIRHQENPNKKDFIYLADNPKLEKPSDCANFVSQVLYASGFQMWEIPNSDNKKTNWHFDISKYKKNSVQEISNYSSSAWRGAESLYWAICGLEKDKYNDYPQSPYFEKEDHFYVRNAERKEYAFEPMDLVFIKYADDTGKRYGHVMVVVGFDGENNPVFAHQSNTSDYTPNLTLDQIYNKQDYAQEAKDIITKMTVVRLKYQ